MIPKSLDFRKIFDAALMPVVVVLVGVGAFGLGRLSRIEEAKTPLIIRNGSELAVPVPRAQTAAAVQGVSVQASAAAGPIVASKSGTKYYLSTCSGAKNIKDANKVYFASTAEAQAAGYTAAANCPGLQ